jgi:DNA repair/transcription protein MET18/MMS19
VYAPADDENAIAEDVAGIASEICEECLKLLQEPEKNQAGYAAKVLSAFLSTTRMKTAPLVVVAAHLCTASVSQYTLSASIPPLLKTFQDPDEAPNRRPTLAHLSTLVSAAQSAMSTDSTPLLSVFKDEVLGAFTAGLKLSSVAPPALTGLKSMVSTPGLLTDEEIGYVVHSVNEILQEDADDELRSVL